MIQEPLYRQRVPLTLNQNTAQILLLLQFHSGSPGVAFDGNLLSPRFDGQRSAALKDGFSLMGRSRG